VESKRGQTKGISEGRGVNMIEVLHGMYKNRIAKYVKKHFLKEGKD
jgi:hypothetical protein